MSNILHLAGSCFYADLEKQSPGMVIDFGGNEDITTSALSLAEVVHEQNEALTRAYLDLQAQLFTSLKGTGKNDRALELLLSVFEASPFKNTTAFDIFKLIVICDTIKAHDISVVHLHGMTADIRLFFKTNAAALGIEVRAYNRGARALSISSLTQRNPYLSWAYRLLKQLKKRGQKPTPLPQRKRLLLTYFPGFANDGDRMHSVHYPPLEKLQDDENLWGLLCVGATRQVAEKRIDLENSHDASAVRYAFVDDCFHISDFAAIFLEILRVHHTQQKMISNASCHYKQISFKPMFQQDLQKASGNDCVMQLIWEHKFARLLDAVRPSEIFYPAEFQPWEMALNQIARKRQIKTNGFIHSIIRGLNFHYPKEVFSAMATPDILALNDRDKLQVFAARHEGACEFTLIEAHRFNYLATKKRSQSTARRLDRLLVLLSLNQTENRELLSVVANSKQQFETIIIKPHPFAPLAPLLAEFSAFPAFETAQGDMKSALDLVDLVFVAVSSSTILEAVVLRKYVIAKLSLKSMPMPAIIKAENLCFVKDRLSFDDAITLLDKGLNLTPSEQDISNIEYGLTVNSALPLWRAFASN